MLIFYFVCEFFDDHYRFMIRIKESLLKSLLIRNRSKMYKVHEGEILIKEKYGSTSRQRFYVKPPDQGNVVVLDEGNHHDMTDWFTRIFLPQGYPDSVSKDYMAYQIWDTAQAFCSTITGTLATQEVLRGVGVGDTTATPLAATVTWVIKDGCGHLGKIVFAFTHGTYLDAYSKKWRLYADTLNDAAMCIEMSLPMFRSYTRFALCVSTIMKAVVGVAGGATRVAMTQHHAVRGNLADVSAKDSAQETAVNLLASFTALFIISVFGTSLPIFIAAMVLHVACNYMAVRAVCLRTLNEPRMLRVIDGYLRREVIAAPCDANRDEPIIFYQLGPNLLDLKLSGFQIKLGCSLKKLIAANANASYWAAIEEIYSGRNYILHPNVQDRRMYVLVKECASVDDVLCAYFHAVLLAIIVSAINDQPSSVYSGGGAAATAVRPFAQVCRALQAAEWSRAPAACSPGGGGLAYEPSAELARYVTRIAGTEWRRVRPGLVHTGWDLSKHLLVVDEWRVCNKTMVTNAISMEKLADVDASRSISFGDVVADIESDGDVVIESYTIEPDGSMKEPSRTKVQADVSDTADTYFKLDSDTVKD